MAEHEGLIAIKGCKKCGKCAHRCHKGALCKTEGLVSVDHKKCDLCMECMSFCPNRAIIYVI